MDNFEFQIIMEEGEGGELVELADEEYLQQPMNFTGAEEACQHRPTSPKSSHIPHMHKPHPNTSPGYLLTAAVWEHCETSTADCEEKQVSQDMILQKMMKSLLKIP